MTAETHDDHGAGQPVALGSTDGLGPLPEPDVTALCDYFDAAGKRHSLAYSIDAVRSMLAAERERCLGWCRQVMEHHNTRKAAADEVEQAFFDGEACGAEDCIEAIQRGGDWP